MLYVVAIVVYGVDQLLKWVVRGHMGLGEMISVWPPAVYLDYIRNPGGAFGILPGARWFLVLVALIVILGVVYAKRKMRPGAWTTLALGLLLGGALGNLTDRAITGTVVDYVYFRIINFPVFNFADVAIDAGVLLLVIRSFWGDKAENHAHQDSPVK